MRSWGRLDPSIPIPPAFEHGREIGISCPLVSDWLIFSKECSDWSIFFKEFYNWLLKSGVF